MSRSRRIGAPPGLREILRRAWTHTAVSVLRRSRTIASSLHDHPLNGIKAMFTHALIETAHNVMQRTTDASLPNLERRHALLALALALVPALVYGQTPSGTLDVSFGTGGRV